MTTINDLLKTASKNGFQEYLDVREENHQHLILTCTKGKYDGEVIDILYKYENGQVFQIDHSSQFPNQKPVFRFIGNNS